MNKFEELKRNRYIKKMHSNAIAMVTGQADLREGCHKMEYLYSQADYVQPFDGIEINILKKFSSATGFFPLPSERELYSKVYLSELDVRLAVIEEKYRDLVMQKCEELVEKLQYIKMITE